MNAIMHFHWQSDQDLLEKDASLALGWLEFVFNQLTVCFFKQRLCMTFLTVTSLIDFLTEGATNKEFRWVGEDGGDVYFLTRRASLLTVNHGQAELTVEYELFKYAVYEACKDIEEHAQQLNPSIKSESAFIDFSNAMRATSFGK